MKKRVIWSTLFHEADDVFPNQSPAGIEDLTRQPECTTPEPPQRDQNSPSATKHEAPSRRRRTQQ